jgi:hypothetical protein
MMLKKPLRNGKPSVSGVAVKPPLRNNVGNQSNIPHHKTHKSDNQKPPMSPSTFINH